jgi:hypothetical protein
MNQHDDHPTTGRTGDEIQVATDGVAVTLQKVRTPTGERLAVHDETHGSTRLDALELESLTWQDAAFFDELVDGAYDYRAIDPSPRDPAELQVSNEYTVVRLSVVDDGRAAAVTSPKMGYGTRVDACAFAKLVDKPKTFFSALLETPYGPEDADHDHVV